MEAEKLPGQRGKDEVTRMKAEKNMGQVEAGAMKTRPGVA